MKVEIITAPTHGSDVWVLTKAAATNFLKGQLGSFESSAVVHMDAAGEDATFVGVVAMDARDSETEVTLYKKCQVEMDADSAAYTPGQTVKYNAGAATTDYEVIDADANAIGRSAGEYAAGSTRIRVNFDVTELDKFPGAWEA